MNCDLQWAAPAVHIVRDTSVGPVLKQIPQDLWLASEVAAFYHGSNAILISTVNVCTAAAATGYQSAHFVEVSGVASLQQLFPSFVRFMLCHLCCLLDVVCN